MVGGENAGPKVWKQLANQHGLALKPGAAQKLWQFAMLLNKILAIPNPTPEELVQQIVPVLQLAYKNDQLTERLLNLAELRSLAKQTEGTGQAGLANLLENAALGAHADDAEDNADRVTLVTFHGSKGLEWPVVFIAGAEDGFCPHSRNGSSSDDVEEERRLFYVALTRAKQEVTLSWSRDRMVNGQIRLPKPSLFVRELGPAAVRPERAIQREAV